MISIGRFFLNLIFPLSCETCGKSLPGDGLGVCADCQSAIRLINAPFCPGCGRTTCAENNLCDICTGGPCGRPHPIKQSAMGGDKPRPYNRIYAAAWYDGPIKELIHAYKYKSHKHLAKFFENLLLIFISQHLGHHSLDAVLAIPISKQKEKQRGFNQSLVLSRRIARKLQKPELSHLLLRKNSPTPQALLSKEMRKKNVQNVFEVKNNTALQGKRLLLVDDILTTGETASACAGILKDAGAQSVTVLTCARGV